MEATPQDSESVVGDECHIVSEKPKGPRYDADFPPDHIDSYSNLILLCRVHHKMVDDQEETFTADILRKLKANHESWVSQALASAASEDNTGTDALVKTFQKVKSAMPELIAEMRADLAGEGSEFIREFFVVSRNWVLNLRDPCFCYYFEDHDNLQGKIHVLENQGFVIDVTPGNAKKYRMTEEFVELLVSS